LRNQAAAVRTLEVGQRIRLDVTQLGRLEGFVVQTSESELTVAQGADPTRIGVTQIERLWVRGRATKTGALTGGIVGLVAGLAFGFLVGEVACAETDCSNAEVAAVAGLLGAAGGTALGASIGLTIPKWHLRFP
jgi:hypothetical protein